MEKNLNEIVDRVLGKSKDSVYLCNVSVMGAAPTVIVLESSDEVSKLVSESDLSVSVIRVNLY